VCTAGWDQPLEAAAKQATTSLPLSGISGVDGQYVKSTSIRAMLSAAIPTALGCRWPARETPRIRRSDHTPPHGSSSPALRNSPSTRTVHIAMKALNRGLYQDGARSSETLPSTSPREIKATKAGQPDPVSCSAALFRWLKTLRTTMKPRIQKGGRMVSLDGNGDGGRTGASHR